MNDYKLPRKPCPEPSPRKPRVGPPVQPVPLGAIARHLRVSVDWLRRECQIRGIPPEVDEPHRLGFRYRLYDIRDFEEIRKSLLSQRVTTFLAAIAEEFGCVGTPVAESDRSWVTTITKGPRSVTVRWRIDDGHHKLTLMTSTGRTLVERYGGLEEIQRAGSISYAARAYAWLQDHPTLSDQREHPEQG